MISTETWGILGDVARNTSGVLAVCAAYFTIRVALRTNRSRAREAVRANFRDRIQWAVAHVDSENELEQTLAEEIILKYRFDEELEAEDLRLARAVAQKFMEREKQVVPPEYHGETAADREEVGEGQMEPVKEKR